MDDALITEFLEESIDSLTSLDEKIADLVHSKDLVNDVNQIFRPVHSIKGAASFFKLTGLMSMAHKLETVLDKLRQKQIELTASTIELLNRGFFLLKLLVERCKTGQFDTNSDEKAFLEELETFIQGGGKNKKKTYQDLLGLLSKVEASLLAQVKSKLESLLDIEPEKDQNDPLQNIIDSIKLQISSPSAEHIAKVRKLSAEHLAKVGEGECAKGISAFLEDFNALADSPVGVDEMMAEVLYGHLEVASKVYPKAKSEVKPEVNLATSENKEGDHPEGGNNTGDAKVKGSSSIRVNLQLLEDIMDLMSELVLSRNELNVFANNINHVSLSKITQQISLVMTELQGKVMKTRLQPVSTVFNPLPGVVREISRVLNKEVDLVLEGKDTELDRSVLEGIKDPLTHLIRNSLDHGFEMPDERKAAGKPQRCKLSIKAFHEGGQVVIEIRDDGRGVNIKKVASKAVEKGVFSQQEIDAMSDNQKAEIIFHPGFSTADAVSQVSGRGVGMDVVKSNIVAMGGQVELDTKFGKGTLISLKIPLTLAIVPTLIVGAMGRKFALPQASLEEMVLLKPNESHLIERVRGVEVYRLRGKILPIVRLNRLLGLQEKDSEEGIHIVVLSASTKSFGLIVEELFDIEEIVVKSLSDFFADNLLFSGVTILGDGSISLIIDMLQLAEKTGMSFGTAPSEAVAKTLVPKTDEGQVLLFSLGEAQIYGIPMGWVERLEQIKWSAIETINDRWFWRYRGRVMPLASAWLFLQDQNAQIFEDLHVVVFRQAEQEIGFVVRDIVDVVPMEGSILSEIHDEPHLLGSAILQKKIVTLINLPFVGQNLCGVVRSPISRAEEDHFKNEIVVGSPKKAEAPLSKKDPSKPVSNDGAWQSQLESEQLSDVISDILKAKLES